MRKGNSTTYEQRVRAAIQAEPLAQMHLLLNQHGWATTENERAYEGRTFYRWSHPGHPDVLIATRHRIKSHRELMIPNILLAGGRRAARSTRSVR